MAMQSLSPRPLVECPVCQGPLQPVGRLPVRQDAAQSGVISPPAAGDAAPVLGLDVYRCHDCGRLELYDFDYLLTAI